MINWIANLLFPILGYLYTLTHNWGVALILFAVLAKIALLHFTNQQFKSMKEMQVLQPEIKRLQETYKNNPKTLNEEFLKLLRSRKVNPFSGCLFSMVFQLPILWAIYYVIKDHIKKFKHAGFLWIGPYAEKLYRMFPSAANKVFSWHGICSLGFNHQPSFPFLAASLARTDWPLLILYGLSMIGYSRLSAMPSPDPSTKQTQAMMNLMLPIISVIIFSHFPSAFILYWLTFNLLSLTHQWVFYKIYQPEPPPVGETKRRKVINA
jgi:YidC/Oxa1 family membrane protein insertase